MFLWVGGSEGRGFQRLHRCATGSIGPGGYSTHNLTLNPMADPGWAVVSSCLKVGPVFFWGGSGFRVWGAALGLTLKL